MSGNAAVAARPTRSLAVCPERKVPCGVLGPPGSLKRLPRVRQPPDGGVS